VLDAATLAGRDETDADDIFHTIRDLRIPVEYLAELFTAGDADAVAGVLMKLAGMRTYMRARTLDGTVAADVIESLGMTGDQIEAMYRLLAVAKYDERYIIPTAYARDAAALDEHADTAACSLDQPGGPGMGDPRSAVETLVTRFHLPIRPRGAS
jgi:nitrate reductase beta subunit